jgi:hypothetical protein
MIFGLDIIIMHLNARLFCNLDEAVPSSDAAAASSALFVVEVWRLHYVPVITCHDDDNLCL